MMANGRAGEAGNGDRLLLHLPRLLHDLAEGAILELDVSVGDARLYVRQWPDVARASTIDLAQEPAAASGEDAGLVAITTPLTGVFYAAPSPEEPAYVNADDEVEVGQVVALVEAMKVFNEIRAEVAGVIASVEAATGQFVAAGATLFWLRPHGAAPPAEDDTSAAV